MTDDITVKEAQEADVDLPQEEEEEVAPDLFEDAPEDIRKYASGRWHGKPNYQCSSHKGFKTVDPATFRSHVTSVHPYNWLED